MAKQKVMVRCGVLRATVDNLLADWSKLPLQDDERSGRAFMLHGMITLLHGAEVIDADEYSVYLSKVLAFGKGAA